MPVEYINITIPESLKKALDQEVKRKRTKRSTLIQRAVVLYLRLARQKSLQGQLREGYLEMAEESRAVMRAFDALDRDALKHVD